MKNNSFSEIKQIIDTHDNLLIISHILPDGDNIGSVLGLANCLTIYGKKVTPVSNGTIPEYYRFFSGIEKMIMAKDIPSDGKYDLIIYLDAGDKSRVWNGKYSYEPNYDGVMTINIDHHVSNDYFADYNYVDAQAAATCEIISHFIKDMGLPIDSSVTTPLYTGLLTDTGRFTFMSTSDKTMTAASYLLNYCVDMAKIRENVYENVSYKRKRLMGYILDNLHIFDDKKVVWASIDYDTCKKFEVTGQDFEGINEEMNTIAGVKICILFRELEPSVVKVGYRAKTGYDVNYIASKFNGGGHILASGCTIHDTLVNSVQNVLNVIKEYMEDRA